MFKIKNDLQWFNDIRIVTFRRKKMSPSERANKELFQLTLCICFLSRKTAFINIFIDTESAVVSVFCR